RSLGIFDEHIEVAVGVEAAGIDELEFRICPIAAPILFDQLVVREGCLRVFVEVLHVGMCGCRIEVEIIFLDVFAMVSFVAGQTVEALLQNGIAPIPKRKGETHILVPIANAGQTIFVPTIGPRTGMVVWKMLPSGPIGAVVLAHSAPGPFTEIGAPAFPMFLTARVLFEALLLGYERRGGRRGSLA